MSCLQKNAQRLRRNGIPSHRGCSVLLAVVICIMYASPLSPLANATASPGSIHSFDRPLVADTTTLTGFVEVQRCES